MCGVKTQREGRSEQREEKPEEKERGVKGHHVAGSYVQAVNAGT